MGAGTPFPEEVAPGGVLVFPAIRSPNYVAGVSGWAVNSDGSAQFNQLNIVIQASGLGLLIYSGVAGPGNLIGSWAAVAGTDAYGNPFPAGLYVNQGALSGVLLSNPQIVGATILSSLLSAPVITSAAITGGTISETTISFDQTAGRLLVYSTTTTTVTLTAGATWTAPAGNYSQGKIECWGAGAGGGGGGAAAGGITGGGGEYACEPNYPLTPGSVYNTQIGQGGQGATNNNDGFSGGDTLFDNSGVVAYGGLPAISGLAGVGGQWSSNTIHFSGGNGATASSTGGASGANSGNPAGAGNNGLNAAGAGGAGSPGAQSGSGTGGPGGSNAANGSNGGAPGGAGGGCGAGSGSVQGSNQYRLSNSATYAGSDSSGTPNIQEYTGTMYQGGETASGGSFNGTQKALGIIGGSPAADLSGKTIDSVTIRLENLHTWYNWGCYVNLGYTSQTSLPGSWNGSGISNVKVWRQNEGANVTTDVTGAGLGSAMQSGAAKSISLGPGSPGFNLNNYGSFYGAGGDNNQNPLITVKWHTGAAPTAGGNGANGQIKITYTSASTLLCSVAPAAGTDPVTSAAYPAGFGRLEGSQYTQIRGTQTSVTPVTVTSASSTNLSANWTIPANDAVVGTKYRLTGSGWGVWGSTQEALSVGPGLATRTRTETILAATFGVSIGFEFQFEYTLTILTATTAWMASTFMISQVGGSHGTAQVFTLTGSNGSSTGEAFVIANSNTIAFYASWAATTGSPTLTCRENTLERIGP